MEELRISRSISEDNIKIDVQEPEHESVDWINLDQDTNQWLATLNTVSVKNV
jgi:hypothetical protein